MIKNFITESFYPIHDLKDKRNYQRFILVDKDGKNKKRIILFISDIELREEIICLHYLSRYIQIFLKETVGVKYKSRDKPWDFDIELSNGEIHIIEITSIADQTNLFKSFTSQGRLLDKSLHETISFRELLKLNILFPDPEVQKLINGYQKQDIEKDETVSNPYFNKQFVFESSLNENFAEFGKILKEAVDKKVKKKHPNKENVTLIIDNRTISYSLEDVMDQLGDLDDYFAEVPFKEVWMYTGYYSDFDGNNAEYSLVPLKISSERSESLRKIIDIK